MAEFTYEISDEQLAEMGEAFCQQYNYDPKSNLTPLQFTLGRIDVYIKDVIKAHRIWKQDESIKDVKKAAIDEVDSFVINVKKSE